MTKIDIISGFLGAGKTTLIKKLLSEALKGEQVVLIENEFGEIGIDGGFLKDSGIEIREMNSGCICCSLVGDFGTSLKEVITTYHPDRIIIEPSGVGKLSDVIKAVKGVDVDCEISLNSYTTVADVNKCKMYMRNFGEFFENQLQYARTIILSRTDTPKATEEKVAKAVALIREVNKDAVIITTPIEKLDGAQILEAMEQGREEDEDFCPVCGGHHDHDHHHDDECGHDHDHEHHHHDHDDECGCGHDHDHEHTMMTSADADMTTIMSITMTASADADMIMTMNIIIMTASADADMITIMNIIMTASADVVMTTTITMRMKYLQAGVVRLLRNIQKKRSKLH